ncbi:MAG: methyl-accepting chemotaxis protein [Treponema sp.]|nr:methyl-accepting chemotaxis protein [Treponema sp.]
MNLNKFKEFFKIKRNQQKDINVGREIYLRLLRSVTLSELCAIPCCIGLGNIPKDMLAFIIILGVIICVLLNFLLLLISTSLITQSTSEELNSFYFYETTEKERTRLIRQVMRLPQMIAAEVFVIYVGTGAIWISVVANVTNMDITSLILFGAMEVAYAYYAVVHAFTAVSQSICSKHASKIVEKGLSSEEVEKKHTFGTKSAVITVLHIFAPIAIIGTFLFIFAWRAHANNDMSDGLFIGRLILICAANIFAYCISSTMLFKRMMKSIYNMRDILNGMNKETLHKVKFEATDLSNEFQYNVYLINTIVSILQKILKESSRISTDVIESSNELSVISRETAVTSLEQNSGIKELLSAMEETDTLSKNIAEKIGEVSIVAKKTTDNIVDGFDILKQNMHKLDEIKAANDITVEGIKKLTEKISGISDIARIINDIADQTNIIAFNAELEASSAGDVGENFSLVANEIRRLTNSTIQSTNEIRNRLTEIQHSSDVLLVSSQAGSHKIIDGTKLITDLNQRFEELKQSSETMDYASGDIRKIIEQQTASFAQIVVTLRQIAQSAETFSTSTQKISDSAQNLCLIAEKLKILQPNEVLSEEKMISEVL